MRYAMRFRGDTFFVVELLALHDDGYDPEPIFRYSSLTEESFVKAFQAISATPEELKRFAHWIKLKQVTDGGLHPFGPFELTSEQITTLGFSPTGYKSE
jgi:hypothetical protein